MNKNLISEAILTEYFRFEAALGEYLPKERILEVLLSYYGLKEKDLGDYLVAFNHEDVTSIKTEDDYKRYKRINQYMEMKGNLEETNLVSLLISIKGRVIQEATEMKLAANKESSELNIKHVIGTIAECGFISAMRMLGILQYEGIFFEENKKHGLKTLRKAASWGDIVSNLALLKYIPEQREEVASSLNVIVKNSVNDYVYDVLKNLYHIDTFEEKRDMKLLMKAFHTGKVISERYDPILARIIFSKTLGIKEKENTLFNENKTLISDVSDLPLQLEYEKIDVDVTSFKDNVINRDNEYKMIIANLLNNDLRDSDNYVPLAIVSDSNYVRNTYLKVIKNAFKNDNVNVIDASELDERDFELNRNNVFVRDLVEDQNNVVVINLEGEIRNAVIDRIKGFLKLKNRMKFHLVNPSVCLDLSSVLPIVIADRDNESKMRDVLDSVEIEDVKKEELDKVLRDIFDNISKSYHVKATISDDALIELKDCSLEEVEKILKEEIKTKRALNDKVEIKLSDIKASLNKASSRKSYGFGGRINEK